MIRRLVMGFLALATAVLVGCGGGGASGDCVLCNNGGGGGGTVTAADLSIALSAQSVSNSGADTVTVTITTVDASRNSLAGAAVAISADSGAVVSAADKATGADGTVTAVVAIGADKSNRSITLTATSGSVTKTATLHVTGTKISTTYASNVTPGSIGNVVHYLVTDVNGVAMPGQAISVSAQGLPSASGTTADNGTYDYVYDAPGGTGGTTLTVTADAGGVSSVLTIQVQAAATVPSAIGPATGSVAAAPNSVKVNTAGSTANQTQVRALFMGANNAPVKNVRVRFDLSNDANSVGGTFASGTTLLYSAADGTVVTSYIPGQRSSPTDGVTVRACWDLVDFAEGACPNQATNTLTVTAEAISVTLGTNELIYDGAGDLTYIKRFVAQVVDSAGNAVSGATVAPVVDVTFDQGNRATDASYMRGQWVKGVGGWSQAVDATCPNEDQNRNGVIDTVPIVEDVNGNGKLEPRKADISVTFFDPNSSTGAGTSKTDINGKAYVQIEYPRNVASWDYFTLTVTASGVSGTEGRAQFRGALPVPAAAVTSTTSSPAFQYSPYGFGACTDPN